MRCLSIVVGFLVFSAAVKGAEVSVSLDRCVVLNDTSDQTSETKIALHFTLPANLSGKEILYSELYFPLSVQTVGRDSLLELHVFPLLSGWTEQDINYESSEDITDSLSAGCYTIKLGQGDAYYIDITPFVQHLAAGERANYGLIAVADLLGDANIRVPENIAGPLRNRARVRIVYK